MNLNGYYKCDLRQSVTKGLHALQSCTGGTNGMAAKHNTSWKI